MKIVIYSPYDCIVKSNNDETFLTSNEHLILDEQQKIFVYPTGKSSKYSFEINFNEAASPLYRIIQKDDKLLVFLIDGLLAENVDIFSFSHKNQDSFIEIGKNQITFKTASHQKAVLLPAKTENIKCGNFEHINYVAFEDKKKSYLIAYNTLSNKTRLFQGNNIELREDGFVLTNSNSFYKNIVEEYAIDSHELKVKSRTFSQRENYSNNFISYMFISSIKIKDYEGAYSLLSQSLQNHLTIDLLKNYFGEISYFYVIDPLTVFAISNGKNVIYEFNIEQDKIKEISDNL